MKRRYGRDFMPRTVSSLFKLLFIGLHNRPALPYNEKKSRGGMAVRRTDESGKFQKNLQKSVAKRIILMILISSLLFLAGQFSATLAANELNASNHLKKLEEVFSSL